MVCQCFICILLYFSIANAATIQPFKTANTASDASTLRGRCILTTSETDKSKSTSTKPFVSTSISKNK